MRGDWLQKRSRQNLLSCNPAQCANRGGGHSANSTRCTLGHKAEINARRKKILDKGRVKVIETNENENSAHDEANLNPEMGMDLETENWVESPEKESSSQEIPEGRDYTQLY